MNLPVRYIGLLFISLLCIGCNAGRNDVASPSAKPDKGQVWQLVSMRGREVKKTTVVTLTLNPETGNLHGKAQCNTYYATFRLSPGGGFKISDLGCGEVSCPDADMNAEWRYLSLLPKVDAMTMTEYTMIFYSKGKEILTFELQ